MLVVPLGLAVLWPPLRDLRRWRAGQGREPGAGRGRRQVGALLGTAAAFGLPVVLCVAPYAAFLHTHTGQWSLTAKTQDVSLEAWHAVARADRLTRDSILYQLDETGLRFEDEHTSLPDLARDDPAGYAAILRTNLSELGSISVGWSLVPLPISALAIWGAWSRRRAGSTYVALAVGLLPVATAVAFFVQPRYLVLAVAMATALAGVGVAPRRGAGGRSSPSAPWWWRSCPLSRASTGTRGGGIRPTSPTSGWRVSGSPSTPTPTTG